MQITKEQFNELCNLINEHEIDAAVLIEEDFEETFDWENEGGIAIEGTVWGVVDTDTRHYPDSPPEHDQTLLRFYSEFQVFDGEGNQLSLSLYERDEIETLLEKTIKLY